MAYCLLSNEIGIDISLIQTEASVGRFNVDILAEEESGSRKIVIENQLESTDHDHLGKIITYASGFDAEIIIWIVKDVRNEHKQAIDWLNENTTEKVNFFAINIELWQIGESEPAPKFNIISKPNNWAKALKKSTSSSSVNKATDLEMLQLEFWTALNYYFNENGASVNTRAPRPQSWYDLSLGCGKKAHSSLGVHNRKGYCSVQVYITDSKELYAYLAEHKENIEQDSGVKFEWMELPKRQVSRIIAKNYNFSINDANSWSAHHKWLLETLEKIKPIFVKYIKQCV